MQIFNRLKWGKKDTCSVKSVNYLIEIRLSGPAKKYVKTLVFDVAKTFSVRGVTQKRVVPHITIIGPIETRNEQQLVKEMVEICKKYDLMSIKFKGIRTFGNWLFGKRVIGLNIEVSNELELFRSEIAEKLSVFCKLCKFDTKEWKPHATIAFKDIDHKFDEIKSYVKKQSFSEMNNYVLRVTLLKHRKIFCEYDFLQCRLLNRDEALSIENKRKTLRLLKEKVYNR